MSYGRGEQHDGDEPEVIFKKCGHRAEGSYHGQQERCQQEHEEDC